MRTWTVWNLASEQRSMERLDGLRVEEWTQEAETLEVSGGALVFRVGAEIVAAVGPGAWASVEPTRGLG